MLDAVVAYHVGRFARTIRMPREDLEQEARVAVVRAVNAYDPALASLRTHASRCVYRHMVDLQRRQDRRRGVLVDAGDEFDPDEWESDDAGPEDAAVFREMLRELPGDARAVCDLVFGDASLVAGLSRVEARRALREALGWPGERVRRAFAAISAALDGGGRGMIRASR